MGRRLAGVGEFLLKEIGKRAVDWILAHPNVLIQGVGSMCVLLSPLFSLLNWSNVFVYGSPVIGLSMIGARWLLDYRRRVRNTVPPGIALTILEISGSLIENEPEKPGMSLVLWGRLRCDDKTGRGHVTIHPFRVGIYADAGANAKNVPPQSPIFITVTNENSGKSEMNPTLIESVYADHAFFRIIVAIPLPEGTARALSTDIVRFTACDRWGVPTSRCVQFDWEKMRAQPSERFPGRTL